MLDQVGKHAEDVMTTINGSAAAQSEIVLSWRKQTSPAQAEQFVLERAPSGADHRVWLAATRLGISRSAMHRKMKARSIFRKKEAADRGLA